MATHTGDGFVSYLNARLALLEVNLRNQGVITMSEEASHD